jgi:hypothetical protein
MGHTSAFSVAYFTQVRCGAFSPCVALSQRVIERKKNAKPISYWKNSKP